MLIIQICLAGSVVPIRISEDWKHIRYAANANGFINVCHFSDTFLIYVNYCLRKPGSHYKLDVNY